MKLCGAIWLRHSLVLRVRKGFLWDVTFDLAPEGWIDINLEQSGAPERGNSLHKGPMWKGRRERPCGQSIRRGDWRWGCVGPGQQVPGDPTRS